MRCPTTRQAIAVYNSKRSARRYPHVAPFVSQNMSPANRSFNLRKCNNNDLNQTVNTCKIPLHGKAINFINQNINGMKEGAAFKVILSRLHDKDSVCICFKLSYQEEPASFFYAQGLCSTHDKCMVHNVTVNPFI